jgi:hypothetical protein
MRTDKGVDPCRAAHGRPALVDGHHRVIPAVCLALEVQPAIDDPPELRRRLTRAAVFAATATGARRTVAGPVPGEGVWTRMARST